MYRIFLTALFSLTCITLIVISTTVASARHKQNRLLRTENKRVTNRHIRKQRVVTPTQIPSKTPTPTSFVRPTRIITQAIIPTQKPSGEEYQTFIMNEINAYRISKGLSRVEKNVETCAFAKTRAQEITTSFNHDGFRNRIDNKSLPYPSYASITENIAMNSDYKEVVNQWIQSSGHAENMQKDTPYVCVERVGNYYAYEGWKPL